MNKRRAVKTPRVDAVLAPDSGACIIQLARDMECELTRMELEIVKKNKRNQFYRRQLSKCKERVKELSNYIIDFR